MNTTKTVLVSVVVALLISLGVGFYFVGSIQSSFGGLSSRDIQATSLKVASSGNIGSKTNVINEGTCYFAPSAATIVASSSQRVTCQNRALVSQSGIQAIPGVKSGDKLLVTLSTTSAAVQGTSGLGLVLGGATASSTNGYIELTIYNLTGGTYTWPVTGNATGTASFRAIR